MRGIDAPMKDNSPMTQVTKHVNGNAACIGISLKIAKSPLKNWKIAKYSCFKHDIGRVRDSRERTIDCWNQMGRGEFMPNRPPATEPSFFRQH